jgi:hypothetical protein
VIIVRAFFYPPDSDYTYTIGFTTSAIETNLAIITASAAAMKPLFKRWFPRLFSTMSASGGYTDGPYGFGTGKNTRKGKASSHGTKHKSIVRSNHAPFEMKGMRGLTEIQSADRDGSEEEIMTYNGIVKTTNVSVRYGAYTEDQEDIELGKTATRKSAESMFR